MKKIDLGQSITILANIGVLIGIVLLFLELNRATQATQGQTRSDIADQQMNVILQRAINPALADLYMRARAGEPLTDLEEEQLRAYYVTFWRHRENVSYQYRNGLYDDEEYGATRESWRFLGNEPTERASFCGMRQALSPAFVSEVDALLEKRCD